MDKSPSAGIYGLIGYPVRHSLSPLMHNAAFQALNINAEYRLFEVRPADLEAFLLEDISVQDTEGNSVLTRDIRGFNVTIPHKLKAKRIIEKGFSTAPDAYLMQQDLYYVKLSGAINTVKRVTDRLECRNTDAVGFLRSLETDLGFKTANKNILLFGCGGAGRAIIAALSWKQSGVNKIYAYDKSEEAVSFTKEHFASFAHLKYKLEFISSAEIAGVIGNCQLLVNASSAGMREEDPQLVESKLLHKELSVYDVVYNRRTPLIRDAKSLGLPCADGLGMLLHQGIAAFEFWTGGPAPVEAMREALNKGADKL